MVMVLPPMVADAVAGGLLGGALLGRQGRRWRREEQTGTDEKMLHGDVSPLGTSPADGGTGPDAMIVAPHGPVRKPDRESRATRLL